MRTTDRACSIIYAEMLKRESEFKQNQSAERITEMLLPALTEADIKPNNIASSMARCVLLKQCSSGKLYPRLFRPSHGIYRLTDGLRLDDNLTPAARRTVDEYRAKTIGTAFERGSRLIVKTETPIAPAPAPAPAVQTPVATRTLFEMIAESQNGTVFLEDEQGRLWRAKRLSDD